MHQTSFKSSQNGRINESKENIAKNSTSFTNNRLIRETFYLILGVITALLAATFTKTPTLDAT